MSKKYVSKELSTKLHEKAQKFVDWLKEAEEEDSEEEEEDVAVTFTSSNGAAVCHSVIAHVWPDDTFRSKTATMMMTRKMTLTTLVKLRKAQRMPVARSLPKPLWKRISTSTPSRQAHVVDLRFTLIRIEDLLRFT